MDSVNEKSSATVTVEVKDKDKVLAQPTSATYRIDDVDSGDEVRADKVITMAGGTEEIDLEFADNTMVDATKKKEVRRLTVDAIYNAGVDEVHEEFLYELINLEEV